MRLPERQRARTQELQRALVATSAVVWPRLPSKWHTVSCFSLSFIFNKLNKQWQIVWKFSLQSSNLTQLLSSLLSNQLKGIAVDYSSMILNSLLLLMSRSDAWSWCHGSHDAGQEGWRCPIEEKPEARLQPGYSGCCWAVTRSSQCQYGH